MGCVGPQHIKKWKPEEKVLLGSLGALCVIDGLQTHSDWDSDRKELNPLVKDDASMIAFGATSFYLTTYTVDRLEDQRMLILVLANIIEISNVWHNHRIGIRIKF